MKKQFKITFPTLQFLSLLLLYLPANAQQKKDFPDSTTVRLITRYDSVSNLHRKLFGENYRKDYSLPTKLPIIRISQIGGGLTALQRGGGNQSKSLRLMDPKGKEWVLRSVEKYSEVLLPLALRQTFAKDVIKDNMSAQHPFSALVVPVFAQAAGVAHTDPVIGLVAPDENLGKFAPDFVNTVCLLEEREPLGKSDNTAKMMKRLAENSNIQFDAEAYLKLKCIDVLLGDWDRHSDQWRWLLDKKGDSSIYRPIPRDRDQIFYGSDGLIQRFAQSSWFLPMMQGYERNIKDIDWYLWEGREINAKWFSQLDEPTWDKIVRNFCDEMTDEVLEAGLKKLPEPGYSLRHDSFMAMLQKRRSELPSLMNHYYRFFNRIVDIELTDDSEWVFVNASSDSNMQLSVKKISKNNQKTTFSRVFDPAVTKEIRLYLRNGNDHLTIEGNNPPIKLRVVGGDGEKSYTVNAPLKNVALYEKKTGYELNGQFSNRLKLHLSDDSANTAYAAKDLYRRRLIFPVIGFNNDDGLAVGMAFNFKNPGFRKLPYGNSQTVSFLYSFATSAIKFTYKGEWVKAVGKADFGIDANAYTPNNTQNFFGLGNQTPFEESRKNITYYRARFNLYQLQPYLKWRNEKSSFSIGPALEYYAYDQTGNVDRFITQTSKLYSPDSAMISRNKIFSGAIAQYTFNSRNSDVLPTKGFLISIQGKAYGGLNSYSNSYGQINSSIAYHLRLDSSSRVVISDRVGGGITLGKPAFYQSQFLGGQDNLLGFRQYRFAGTQMAYNNLELRIKLANLANYVLPGQIGLIGHYDIGRVWKKDEDSDVWHQSVGGGLYFAPASMTVIRVIASYSREGWYPYIAMKLRY